MKVKRIKAAYFSPTGGTEKACEMLAAAFGLPFEMCDITLPIQREKPIAFAEGELLLLAVPVYEGSVPVVKGLFDNLKGNAPCVIMACYGNRHYDNALAQMKAAMELRGFAVAGALACIIPHIYSEKIGANRPNQADRERMEKFAKDILSKLDAGETSCNVPGDASAPHKIDMPLPKVNKEKCKKCGACVALCPVGAIDPSDFSVDTALCISCMRCGKSCDAWEYDASANAAWLEARCLKPREIEVFF